ncbi:MAG: copper resistance protein CopC, partial [Burkholderiales bacterium]|nr:copper resistance protein CopC [Anaerolineae bacterium]
MRRILVFGAALLALTFLSVSVVWAHANLLRSEPAPNAVLLTAPDEIRLWFSEPLEPDFSRITLRDANGETLELPPSQLEPSDPFQMFIEPGALTDGLYTVAWRVLSSADGHETRGSFPLTIGTAVVGAGVSTEIEDEFPVDGALI